MGVSNVDDDALRTSEIVVTTSIGIAILRDASAEDADALAKRADAALYEAKAAGRNTFRVSNALA